MSTGLKKHTHCKHKHSPSPKLHPSLFDVYFPFGLQWSSLASLIIWGEIEPSIDLWITACLTLCLLQPSEFSLLLQLMRPYIPHTFGKECVCGGGQQRNVLRRVTWTVVLNLGDIAAPFMTSHRGILLSYEFYQVAFEKWCVINQ